MSAMMVKELEFIEKLCHMNLGIQMIRDHIWCSRLMIVSEKWQVH